MGDRPRDIRADIGQRVAQLAASGVPSSHIARRLGIPRKEVNRHMREVTRCGRR